MCGIFGMFDPLGNVPAAPLGMLAHRGPDSHGEWRLPDGTLSLGHTRLAIIDLTPTGAQPMVDETTGNVIVFNGEIYNHRDIRSELGNRVSAWRGTSDTETILRGYAIFGSDLWPRLKGMFAFLIYDAQRRQIVAVRDRFGIKPVYVIKTDGRVAFASEVNALRPFFPMRPTPASISAYLRVGACPEELLLCPEVEVLPAAHELRLSTVRGECVARCYWAPSAPEPVRPARRKTPVEQVRALLERAVEEHLLADVPVASFLSGGIDSSIITALAARHAPSRLKTFSVGFPQLGFDETAVAAEVATRCQTDHVRIELSESEVIEMVGEAVAAMDLPSIDALNTFVVSRAVSRAGIKVALSGLGGDELFGGYPSFADVPRLRWVARLPSAGRQLLALFGGAAGRRLMEAPHTSDATELAAWRRVFWTSEMLTRAGLPLRDFATEPLPLWADDFSRISWAELSRYMRHILLRDSDQMSMAVSLELRVPFLDHELVDYVLALPEAIKRRPRGMKGLLVEACRDLLPSSVYLRPKMGFGLPMDAWMRGPLESYVARGRELLEAQGLLSSLTLRSIQAQFESHRLHWTRYWAVVVLGHYLHRHGQAPAKPIS